MASCPGSMKFIHINPPLINEDKNTILNDNFEEAEHFNNYFSNISSMNLDNAPELDPSEILLHNQNHISSTTVTREDVNNQIKPLYVTKAYGHDGLSPYFIK